MREMMRRIVLTGVCVACVVAQMAAQTPHRASAVDAACAFDEVSRAPLVVADGLELYVEPQSLTRLSSGELLLAGTPNYLWRRGADEAELVARDSFFGAVLGERGAQLVPAPMPARLMHEVRTLARPGGGWSTAFVEAVRPRERGEAIEVAGLWYGEHDGVAWTVLERVPLPAGYRFPSGSAASRLAQRGDTLIWALQARHARHGAAVFVLERVGGVWSHEQVRDRGAAYVELAQRAGAGTFLLTVATDGTLRRDGNSLFLHDRRSGWQPRKLAAGLHAPVHLPSLVDTPAGLLASWIAVPSDGRPARALLAPERGGDGVLTLDARADRVVPVVAPGGRVFWVVDHMITDDDRIVRVSELVGDAAVARQSIPSPFRGYFTAGTTRDDELLIVGPLATFEPRDPVVVSLLIRLRTVCDGRAP